MPTLRYFLVEKKQDRRKGIGRKLIASVLKHYGITANELLLNQPTRATINLMVKYFGLDEFHPNRSIKVPNNITFGREQKVGD